MYALDLHLFMTLEYQCSTMDIFARHILIIYIWERAIAYL